MRDRGSVYVGRRQARSILPRVVLLILSSCAVLLLGTSGCSGVGTECRRNSDCNQEAGLICAFGTCSVECTGDVDCDGNWICVNDADDGTPDGRVSTCKEALECQQHSECSEGFQCVNGQCRNACVTAFDCVPGQICWEGGCLFVEDAKKDPTPSEFPCRGDAGMKCGVHSDCLSNLCGMDAICRVCETAFDCGGAPMECWKGTCVDPAIGLLDPTCPPLPDPPSPGSSPSGSSSSSSSSSGSSSSGSSSSGSSSSGSSGGPVPEICSACLNPAEPKSPYFNQCKYEHDDCLADPDCKPLLIYAYENCGANTDMGSCIATGANLLMTSTGGRQLFKAMEECVACANCASPCQGVLLEGNPGTSLIGAYCNFLSTWP